MIFLLQSISQNKQYFQSEIHSSMVRILMPNLLAPQDLNRKYGQVDQL